MYNDLRSKLELYKTNRTRSDGLTGERRDKAFKGEAGMDGSTRDENSYAVCPGIEKAGRDPTTGTDEKEGAEIKADTPSDPGCGLQELLPGKLCNNSAGSCYLIENSYELQYFHGSCRLGAALDIGRDTLLKLCPELAGEVCLKDFAFLDTETTGLSGGAGTVAFLIGIGFFNNDGFTVRQYFMRDYDEEAPMLEELNSLLKGFKGLVTFNGRSFDWNLLQSRFTFNRMRCGLKEPWHIDLLHPSRRLWKLRLESCSLSSLEQHILMQQRRDDIPGAMIPAVYFKYLDDRNAEEIVRVIEHNRTDIVSMISLLVRIACLLENPGRESVGSHELLGVGGIFGTAGLYREMVECYEKCAISESSQIRVIASRRLGKIYKRNREYDKAVSHWQKMSESEGSLDVHPFIELAKYYEHQARDYRKALELAENAMKRLLSVGIRNGKGMDELKKRMERLNRKVQRYKQ